MALLNAYLYLFFIDLANFPGSWMTAAATATNFLDVDVLMLNVD